MSEHSNYDEARSFAEDVICRYKQRESWTRGDVVARQLAERVLFLTDELKRPAQPIQDRLQALAAEMQSVALEMLAADQSTTMQSKGVELQGAAATVSEWLESMRAEETIQGFVDGRKM